MIMIVLFTIAIVADLMFKLVLRWLGTIFCVNVETKGLA